MRRKERALVIIQRASAIAAVAVFVLWVASVWWYLSWTPSRGYTVAICAGGLDLYTYQPSSRWNNALQFSGHVPGFKVVNINIPLKWWFDRVSTPTEWSVGVPLWVFEVPTLALAAALWRRNTTAARRVKAGQCAKCGYDRTGLAPEHPCPECGAATPNR